ncbi:MAG: F0F1 ATP synthase subunit A [Phycisphaerae bacterium]|nr:F0F1 ATP synthase subunit A [Phycisphaerae bacterium]
MTTNILAADNPLSHVVQHPLFPIGDTFVFSSHMLMMLVAGVLMVIIFPMVARQKTMVPTGLRNFFESICVFIREEVARPALGDNTDRFIKYIWTTFFFILFCNLLGMIPTGSIMYLASGFKVEPLKYLGGTATANIWVTGALAGLAFVMTHVSGIIQQGPWAYIKNFIPHVPWPMIPVMYVLEAIGALVKPFALALRLFANMLAGHTVLGALIIIAMASQSYTISVVTLFGCAALSLLELFVAFLQAYIFTFLMTMFIASAVHPEH